MRTADPWTSIAMMLRQVDNEGAKRHWHVERSIVSEPMRPIHFETCEVDVELLGPLEAEDPQYRDRSRYNWNVCSHVNHSRTEAPFSSA